MLINRDNINNKTLFPRCLNLGGCGMKKIAVIGGGPAGLIASIEGAKNGADITLYEKYNIGENIRCAEGFFDSLNLLGEPKYGVKFKVDEVVLQLGSSYSFSCNDKINIWILDRTEWQKCLADEARLLGVNIIENTPINKERFLELTDENDYVIDSTGVPSISSLTYGFNKRCINTSAITAQYKLQGDFKWLHKKIKVGFEEHYLGYYWIFPKSENEANVGIGWFIPSISKNNSLNLWTQLDRILEKEGISSYKKVNRIGGLCPVEKLNTLVYKNVLLVGDAAGLASHLHGGGIDTACISGQIAIQSILNDQVDKYEDKINSVLGKKIRADKTVFEWWKSLNYNDFENIINLFIKNTNTNLEFKDLLNGSFSLLKNIKYIKDFAKLYNIV